jgi:hypothetical protein
LKISTVKKILFLIFLGEQKEKVALCQLCGNTYSNVWNLRAHQSKKHPVDVANAFTFKKRAHDVGDHLIKEEKVEEISTTLPKIPAPDSLSAPPKKIVREQEKGLVDIIEELQKNPGEMSLILIVLSPTQD